MNCQKCRTPLKLDPSLQDLNPAAFDLLVGSGKPINSGGRPPQKRPFSAEPKHGQGHISHDTSSPIFNKVVTSPRWGIAPPGASRPSPKDSTAMSFIMLTDSQVEHPPSPTTPKANGSSGHKVSSIVPTRNSVLDDPEQPLSSKIEYGKRLFEVLSSRSYIHHALCVECTDILLTSLQARLSASTKERDAYIHFLKELKTNVPTTAEADQARRDLAAAKVKEEKAFAELLLLEKEKAQLEEEMDELDAQALVLDKEEEEFWRSRNAFALTLSSFQDTRNALKAAYDHDAQQLERLQKTNVYNDTFCIGHDGNFGTINGLRLGRLSPPNNVEWAEINAAWGMTALLLATVADKLGFSFRGYRISPMGSTSRVDRVDYAPSHSAATSTGSSRPGSATGSGSPQAKTVHLELFSSGDLPLGRTILHRKFNDAMVAFLECVRQLGHFVEKGETATVRSPPPGGMKLPYTIEKDKIGGLSIKLGVSPDEAWTSACKYTLTCCKFLLAHASNVAGSGASRRPAR